MSEIFSPTVLAWWVLLCKVHSGIPQGPAMVLLEGTVLLVPPGDCFSHFCLSFWGHTTGVHTEWLALPSLYVTQGHLRK